MLGQLFLEAHAKIAVTHFCRHSFGKHFFQSFHHLRRAKARPGRDIDLLATVEVVAHDKFRSLSFADAGQRGQRHVVAGAVAHTEQAHRISVFAELALGLHKHLPLPPEAIKVIDES